MQRPEGKTLAAVLAEKAAVTPSHPAIIFQGQTISYAELLQQTEAAARALIAQGVVAGDRVGVLMGNDPAFVVLALAASTLGAALAPLNTWHKQDELAWTIRHAGISVLIATRRFLKTDYAAVLSGLIPSLSDPAAHGLSSRRHLSAPPLRCVHRRNPVRRHVLAGVP